MNRSYLYFNTGTGCQTQVLDTTILQDQHTSTWLCMHISLEIMYTLAHKYRY